MLVSTTETLQQQYQIIDVVKFYYSSAIDKQTFGRGATVMEIFDYMLDKLKEQAEDLDADAIIGLRFNNQLVVGGMSANSNYMVYATAIKFI